MDDAWNDRLSEYLDDELTPLERKSVEAHLATCARCRDDLDGLQRVVAKAGTLRDTAPAAELWPAVASRIRAAGGDPSAQSGSERVRPGGDARRFTFTLPQLIAASVALIVLSGGVVWLARVGGARTDFPPVAADTGVSRPVNAPDRSPDASVQGLQQVLDAGRAVLDPQTRQTFEDNLRTIDVAIAQCREALAADPENLYLTTCLDQSRGKKLDLLRRASALIETGEANGRVR